MSLFSTELRQRRTKKGLSLREASKGCGISRTMLHRYENGIGLMEMSAEKAQALAEFFRWNIKIMLRQMRIESEGGKKK
jgi:transcriptional regulator with XRE-family HTH domain